MGGCPLRNLYPLYSQRPHLPSFFWSGLRGRSHLLLSCCRGPSSLCKGWCHGVLLPKNSDRPSPTTTYPSPPATGRPLTSPSFPLAWLKTWAWNSDLGGHQVGSVVSTARRGDLSPPVRPGHPPLPPPRAGDGGESLLGPEAGRENGRWARVACHPQARPAACDPGSEPEVGNGGPAAL